MRWHLALRIIGLLAVLVALYALWNTPTTVVFGSAKGSTATDLGNGPLVAAEVSGIVIGVACILSSFLGRKSVQRPN